MSRSPVLSCWGGAGEGWLGWLSVFLVVDLAVVVFWGGISGELGNLALAWLGWRGSWGDKLGFLFFLFLFWFALAFAWLGTRSNRLVATVLSWLWFRVMPCRAVMWNGMRKGGDGSPTAAAAAVVVDILYIYHYRLIYYLLPTYLLIALPLDPCVGSTVK